MLPQSVIALGALAFATVASAKPVPEFLKLAARGKHSFKKFKGWDFMSNFDDFYGVDNFSGSSLKFVKEKEIVCKSQPVLVIQQRLAIIQEYYKKILTTQICKVEAQVIVHSQFVSGCEAFSRDLRRGRNHRDVSFDFEVASKIVEIQNKGECVIKDWGWRGDVIGKHAVKYFGDNWNPRTSPISVGSVYDSSEQAYFYSSPLYKKYYKGYKDYKSSYGSSGYNNKYVPPSKTYAERPSYTSKPSYDKGYKYSEPDTYVTTVESHYTYKAPPSYTYNYGSDNSYGYEKPSYGYEDKSNGYEKESYGYDKSYEDKSYGYDKSYEDKSYGYDKSSYDKSSYDKPSYEKPSYDKPSYGYGSEPSKECKSCDVSPSKNIPDGKEVPSSPTIPSVNGTASAIVPGATDSPAPSGDPAEGSEVATSPLASSTGAAAPPTASSGTANLANGGLPVINAGSAGATIIAAGRTPAGSI